jgi:transcriptional regulator with PAS, ATPase and Fis domain
MRRTVRLSAELIGDSAGVVAVRTQAEQLLGRHSTIRRLPSVLLLGETGTGKGLLARALHEAGPRAAGAFVAVNCAAIPETLLEAELFGFDEIGLLPETLQAKLLTVLEDRVVRRLGSTRTETVDVWIITASGEDLERVALLTDVPVVTAVVRRGSSMSPSARHARSSMSSWRVLSRGSSS